MIFKSDHRTRRRFLRVVGTVGAGGLVAVGTAAAEKPETHEGRILTVNDDGESGTLERTSDNKEFQFTIGGGADGGDGGDGGDPRGSITLEPGDSVTIVIETGGSEERAIVVDTGGTDE